MHPRVHAPAPGSGSKAGWAALLCAAGLTAALQVAAPAARAGEAAGARAPRTLVVTGRATLTAVPDTVRIAVGVESQAPSARQAFEAAARRVENVIAAVLALGVPRRDLQTAALSLAPVYRTDERTRQPQLAGYRASYTLQVLLQDPAQAGAVVDAAVEAGANRVESIEFSVQNAGALQQQALAQAVADALAQARALAQAAGVELGELLAIENVAFQRPPVRLPVARAAEVASELPVLPGELEFTASATLTFALR